jgi:hypothetical protein
MYMKAKHQVLECRATSLCAHKDAMPYCKGNNGGHINEQNVLLIFLYLPSNIYHPDHQLEVVKLCRKMGSKRTQFHFILLLLAYYCSTRIAANRGNGSTVKCLPEQASSLPPAEALLP